MSIVNHEWHELDITKSILLLILQSQKVRVDHYGVAIKWPDSELCKCR